jgi:tRNA(fMet)-specific endonuclease VapC
MIALDADVLTDILQGNSPLVARASQIPVHEQAVPVILVEEIVRGRLNAVRRAEAGKTKLTLPRAYELFEATLDAFRRVIVLPYTDQADALYRDWRSQKLRVGTHDLRIGAICVAHSTTLVSRNRRDFEKVPGLTIEIWE